MSDNQNNNKPEAKTEAKWYEIPLRDWVVIASVFYYVVSNAGSKAGSEEKLSGFTAALTEINATLKEVKQKQENSDKENNDKINKAVMELEVLKSRIQYLENKSK